MIGKTISHYKILEKLGGGSRSVVYKAEDTLLERTVALKILSEQWQKSRKARLRFLRGAQAIAQLEHPNICTVYEIETAEGQVFIVMSYIEGQTLSRKLEAGPLEIDEAVDIALQTANGLDAAHNKDIIHRDVKDANIMINTEGVAKILDFGLAKLLPKENITKPRAILGTVHYMSPEQAAGRPVDYSTDIWSLGVVMYKMLTGEYPFKGKNVAEMIKAITDDRPQRIKDLQPHVPEPLDLCVQKMMQKKRRLRHENMEEVIKELKGMKPR